MCLALALDLALEKERRGKKGKKKKVENLCLPWNCERMEKEVKGGRVKP